MDKILHSLPKNSGWLTLHWRENQFEEGTHTPQKITHPNIVTLIWRAVTNAFFSDASIFTLDKNLKNIYNSYFVNVHLRNLLFLLRAKILKKVSRKYPKSTKNWRIQTKNMQMSQPN